MRADGQPPQSHNRALWQRSRDTDMAPDEAERFLDLAGFADGRLDAEDQARIAELLTQDRAAAGDVAAARTLAASPVPHTADKVFERAAVLVDAASSARARVIPFAPRSRPAVRVERFARWGSLAAAIVMAAWLGFALGEDVSIALTRNGSPSDDGFLRELLEPSSGFLRDLTEGAQT
jgi:anti-sigma factor RsiW